MKKHKIHKTNHKTFKLKKCRGGSMFNGFGNFLIHTETNLSTPLDKYKARLKSVLKQPKKGLMHIIYNRGTPDAVVLDSNINNASSNRPIADTVTDTQPYIEINSDNKFLVVLVELIPNGMHRLLWALIITSRTLKQVLLPYIGPTPAPTLTSNCVFRIYAYPKTQQLTRKIQEILYQKQKNTDKMQIAKPMNNLIFKSDKLDIKRQNEYKTYMEYVVKNNLKLITIKSMKVFKDTTSGTAILSKVMS